MNDEPLPPLTPAGRLLVALDTFHAMYHDELPRLTRWQLQRILDRLDRYAREVDDDISRTHDELIA